MVGRDVILAYGICTFILTYITFERTALFFKKGKNLLEVSLLDEIQMMKMPSSVNWEDMTLNDPPVKNWRSIASSKTSRISIVNKKAKYYVGDTVIVQINIRDVDGHRKTKGGDEIRIWTNGGKLTGAAGTVVDNGDGTYQGRVKLLWPGRITINAKVFTPREEIAFLYRNVRHGNTSRVYFGGFSDGLVNETVRCTGSLDLSRTYKGSCDLSNKTHDLPWFCEKPAQLVCSNWEFGQLFWIPLNLTLEQEKMLNNTENQEVVKPAITISAVKRTKNTNLQSDGTILQKSAPCSNIPARETWRARTPVGYAHKGRWFPLFCSSSDHTSENSTRDCLKGRRLWFIGDSTTRQMFIFIKKKLMLELTIKEWTKEKWYIFTVAEDKLRTFSVVYAVHGLPFGHGGERFAPSDLNATHTYIDLIPTGSKDIVLVHFYAHFHTQHPEVLRQSVRKTVEAVRRLKLRAPNTKVIVKGPHAMPRSTHPSDDFWGNIATKILREEFKYLQNDVIYFDLWDITVASESLYLHPDEDILTMIMNFFISLICP